MNAFTDFDLLEIPIEGTNLIEASAGTGKSFSIAGLFLRLIVEKRLPVDEILVVTFTQAATEELRDRIRKKIREAIGACLEGGSGEPFLNGLIRRCGDAVSAAGRLRDALRCFDQAAVMTIHGFCKRMLRENIFESGSAFDTELVTSQEHIKKEIVEDFWRRHLYRSSPLFARYAIDKGFHPAGLQRLLGTWHSHPCLKIIPLTGYREADVEERAFLDSCEAVKAAWPLAREEVVGFLMHTDTLKGNIYRREKVPFWIEGMDDFAASNRVSPFFFEGFEKFTKRVMERALKKDRRAPDHPFFGLCETLEGRREELALRYEERLIGLRAELFGVVRDELSTRKKRRGIQYFDDLLLDLFSALEGKAAQELASVIRGRFQAALVDEFQDTDPLQYGIFRRLFSGGKRVLFLIGDPKQAIYGFRGADVFAYMEAAREVKTRFTLRENWRSEPGLIRAVNALFSGRREPFVYEEILYHPSVPAGAKEHAILTIDGRHEPPFHVWVLDGKGHRGSKGITKTEAREMISRAVALEISRLLRLGREEKALIGGRPLREEDIAVLVRRNDEAVRMQQILSGLRIASVLYSTGNLFDSHEAMEMERLLAGIAAPEDGRAVRAGLSTDMLGLKGEDLEQVMRDEDLWEGWIIRFKEYQQEWGRRGFISMFRHVLREEKILARLMVFPDGERRNTNLLHLGEILHQVSSDQRLHRSGLLKWLSEQRAGLGVGPEEHPIRLESDERAVKLVTVHKSKGLEYPVVFCPFGWEGSTRRRSGEPFVFHDRESPTGLTLDLGSQDREENFRQAEKEVLSENLRLLYVSLTRAQARCYFVWGRFGEAETSAPAYLLTQPMAPEREVPQAASTEERGNPVDRAMAMLAERAGGAMVIQDMPSLKEGAYVPSPAGEESLVCEKFSGKIDREWRMVSFSSLVSAVPHAAEMSDHDDSGAMGAERPVEEKPQGIFSFPAGTRAGIFLHEIFEHLDFSREDPDKVKALIREKLGAYGFDLRWEDTLHAMTRRLLRSPLDPKVPDLSLAGVSMADRLNELEFTFPLRRTEPKALAGLFREHGGLGISREFPERMERLEFSPSKGFMKGFMDLVFRFRGRFHLVDWKSNDLGPRVEDYDQKGLHAAMDRGFYILQYHIYVLALHRYLMLRIPEYRYETHFGTVFYIFLRGVEPERGPEFGIFRARPSEALIRGLEARLIG
ncbi:MAG: exodeoxyribonuclease V subunit beta [Deltaproteobacteria bacterium]|nr:exodeoxyribonuclease V subunit beta [Deltaproteobacteria bacterium]